MNIKINTDATILTDETKKFCGDGDRSFCQYLDGRNQCALFDNAEVKDKYIDGRYLPLRCKKCLNSKEVKRK